MMINYYHTGSIRGNFYRLVVSKLDRSELRMSLLLIILAHTGKMSKFKVPQSNKEIFKIQVYGLEEISRSSKCRHTFSTRSFISHNDSLGENGKL